MENLNLYRTLGSQLIDKGKWFLNRATTVKKTVYSASQVLTALYNITGLPVGKIYSADETHQTTDIDTWKTIIENDWVNKKIWTTDVFDCDNFSGSFTAFCADIYVLNSAARFTIEIRDASTGKHIGYHRAVIIIDSNLDCWLYEPMTDGIVKMEKGKKFILGSWEYIPNYIDIN